MAPFLLLLLLSLLVLNIAFSIMAFIQKRPGAGTFNALVAVYLLWSLIHNHL